MLKPVSLVVVDRQTQSSIKAGCKCNLAHIYGLLCSLQDNLSGWEMWFSERMTSSKICEVEVFGEVEFYWAKEFEV